LDVTALDAGQEERLLALQAGRHVPAAHHCSVVTMFEAQVHSNPTRVAARYLDEQICYGELNRRANRLADALLARGVAPDQVVGIRADRGIDFLVMVLGTLKSGAAYLPLDPKTPPQRVDAILTAARAHMLLSSSMAEELEASGLTDVNPNLCTHPRHLAYVIGTSGSTGVPKGVMVEQRGMLNNQVSKIPYLGLTAQDVVAQTASQNFDIAVWQMLAPLLFGGCVQFVPEEIAQDPARLLEHIAANGVTVLEHVPSLIQEMASADCAVEISKLRWLLATGEALPAEVARSWLSRYPHVRLVNAYGPAECSDDVALHELEVTDADDDSPPPVGYATDNNQLFILDARMNLVPPGGTGELYVAGVGVGRGYAGDPARTAERFVPNPYARAPGDRLYRTGDLARLRSDGAIEFVGRRDHQVKIRGFRIELQEIEAQLRALPQIREAAVVVWAGGRGPRLVAYVVPRDRVSLDVERMRAQLARALPEYMVPATTVVLESLPRNVNGKLDRNALPAPSVLATQQYAAPQGEIEERLAAMWSQVLKVERISRHDNLFDLGGHSLLATQLMARIRRVFGVDIPLRTVLETPVLMSLAEHIRMQGQTAGSQVARIEPVSRDGTLPLSPLQRRVWVVDRLSAGRHGGLRSAYVMRVSLRLVGRLDIAALRGAIDGIIARHEVLRTHYPQDQDGEPAAVIEPAGVTHIELFEAQQRPAGALDAVLPASPSERAAPPAEGQRYVPTAPDEPILDLRRGPVFAANLRREKPDRHVLSLAVHHIAFDGWSQGLFARELVAIYRALTEGHAHGLTPLRIQYVDYAAWQAQQTGERQVMQQFWRDYLREAPVASTIAPDRLRPAVPDTAGATIQLSIPASVTASLTRIANAGRTTLFTVLLGAFCRVLHAHTGAKDLLIGTDVACRDHPDLEDLIGFFVNLIPIRSRATIGSNWLREIRESVLAAFQHRNLPFDEIVEVTGTPRNRAHNPLVQVLFVLQNAPPARIEIPGLAVEALAATTVHSKFDLAVFATPTDGELDVTWVYAESLYEREPINRLTRAFSSLLEELAGGSPCW
jgi:amino acid adenylation domain-containing protein